MLVYSKQHVIISFTLYKISSFIIFCATLIPFTLLVFIYLSLFNSLFDRYAYRYICMTQRVVDKSINNPLGQLSFLNNAYSTTPIRNYINILFNSPWCHFLLICCGLCLAVCLWVAVPRCVTACIYICESL